MPDASGPPYGAGAYLGLLARLLLGKARFCIYLRQTGARLAHGIQNATNAREREIS